MATTDQDRVIKVGDPRMSGLDRFFKITERGSTVRDRDHRRARHVADDGLHPVRQPADPGFGHGQRGDDAPFAQVLTVTALVARRHDARDGHLRELPVRARRRPRAQRVRGVLARRRRRADVAPRDGRHRRRGPRSSRVLVLVGFREAVINAIPQDLKLAIGIGIGLFITIIGLVNGGHRGQGRGHRRHDRPGALQPARSRCSSSASPLTVDARRAAGAGRAADRDPRRRRCSRRS